ncbi:MAG: zinc-binding dehydrogenase [Propionibacteriaceae bacterium]|jgi:threonine dehydrogenase-like Zn-dependent dehydrogenase|nr:zinc-binding dehydrogenase [Propionibacteriaceae bacterium]
MMTRAVRLHGADDLRLDDFELPAIGDDEVLVKVISDSICMSTYKLMRQGPAHKRCPSDIAEHPIVVGHEFAGVIVEVGKNWTHEFTPGEKFAQQPALNYPGSLASMGYSFRYCGGSSTYTIIPHEALEMGCLLHYDGDAFFNASLAEPMSCIVCSYHSTYHTSEHDHEHRMGIKPGGNLLILGGAGPMGLGAIEYPLGTEPRPQRIVVLDTDAERLARAAAVTSAEYAAERGVELLYVNACEHADVEGFLRQITQGAGYDDIFIYAPVRELAEMGDRLLGQDGCLNVFSGPSDKAFSAEINLYDAHYSATHIMGTTGGTTNDLKEALSLAAAGATRPAVMVTHIGGIDAVIGTVEHLPQLPGGKKLTYPCVEMPLTAIADFAELGKTDPLFADLDAACRSHQGLWNAEAEAILLRAKGVEV